MKFWKFQQNSKDDIPLYSKTVSGDTAVKGVYEDLGTVKQQMAVLEQQAREAIERLNRVTDEYEQLQKAHQSLLKSAGEAWQMCNALLTKGFESTQEAVKGLNNSLKEQGVQPFEPLLAGPIDSGTCRVVGDIATDKLKPGMVAKILAPGLRKADGKVIAPALVVQSVQPPEVKETQPENN